MEYKIEVGLKASGYDLVHYVSVENISKSELIDLGKEYELQIQQIGKYDTVQIRLIIDKTIVEDKKNRSFGFLNLTHNPKENSFSLQFQRTYSRKNIKLKDDGTYHIFYTSEKPKLILYHTIPSSYFQETYSPLIKDLKEKRREKDSQAKQSKLKKSTPSANKPKKDTSSFKKCSNCYYYVSSKYKTWCNISLTLVQPDNRCSKFYSPFYKVYSGGGFSPK